MAAGGIHDQLGGGFARYAVDAIWLVPHFEKMLYDNAQLVHLYLDAFLAGGNPAHAATARDILDYVLRDMTHPGGGWYSAEDADSEGQEGKFYCWTHDELSKLLSPEEFIVAAQHFGITKAGNFVDHSHPNPLPGLNVLSIVKPIAGSGTTTHGQSGNARFPLPAGEGQGEGEASNDQKILFSAKQKMLAVRAQRIRPHLDDKILASWNGLMLGAFARASAVLGEDKCRLAAEKNLHFIREKLWDDKSGTLFHRWRDGEHDHVQLLEAYAFLLDGVIHLYEATLNPQHLDFACALASALIAKFHDPANGGFWQTPAGTSDLILRVKDDYDGAEPSGNSVATLVLLKLAAITGREDFREAAESTLQLSAGRLQKQPAGLAYMLQALDFWLDEPRRIVITGETTSAKFQELLRAAHSVYQPNKIILGNTGPVEPFAKTLSPKGEATAFVCTGNACQPPADDAVKLKANLA